MLLECAVYVGNCYGTPAAPVDGALACGKDVILEIEVEGAKQIKRKQPKAVMIFIVPPGFDELEKRLRARGTENEETVQKRVAAAKTEYESVGLYDYIVINDDVNTAAEELKAIITASRCTREKREKLI